MTSPKRPPHLSLRALCFCSSSAGHKISVSLPDPHALICIQRVLKPPRVMDETIHQLTTKFLKTLSANLGKTASKSNPVNGSEILTDPSLQIIIHMISCTRTLREAIETTTGVSTVANDGSSSVKKPAKNNIHNQLFLPLLNGILALLGKMLMDSFTFEPKVSDTAVFTAAYGVLGRHILNLFPEMATKKHKTSGKMLIHHAVFKARPAIAEETVGHILRGLSTIHNISFLCNCLNIFSSFHVQFPRRARVLRMLPEHCPCTGQLATPICPLN